MNRGARREAVFLDDVDCTNFLSLLAELPSRFGVRVHAYALMPNHFHLLLDCPLAGLGRAMQFLQSRYAHRLNLRHTWDGPVWRGRFRSLLVEDDAWWAHLLAYLHLNPVAAHLAPTPDEARWTSHAAFTGASTPPDWLFREEMLEIFGSVDAYRTYLWETQVGRERGPAGFDVARLWTRPRGERPAVPEAEGRSTSGPITLERAWAALFAVTGMNRESILATHRGPRGNPARWLALYWLPRATGLPRAEIALLIGVHPTLVSRAGRRVGRAREEQPLARWLERLEGLVGAGGARRTGKVSGVHD